jgi:hypothetical protein
MNTLTAVDTRANLELAKAFAECKMVPDHFKKSIGDCYIAINLANRYGMEPWMLMMEMYIINGRPMMSGKLATAILNHSLADPLRPEYAGDGDERTITLSGRPEGESKALAVTLKVKDAKTNNEQWKKNPDQMLMYSAARLWGRRYAPDIIMGILFDDEEITSSPIAAPPIQPLPSQPALAPRSMDELIDPNTGEVTDHVDPFQIELAQGQTWSDFVEPMQKYLNHCKTIAEWDQWMLLNGEMMVKLKETKPQLFRLFEKNTEAKHEELSK